jgi:hypothetical protein
VFSKIGWGEAKFFLAVVLPRQNAVLSRFRLYLADMRNKDGL